jgi:hypothetical protein
VRCADCPYYTQNPTENECTLIGFYCFYTIKDCRYVNHDGTQNEEEIRKANF